MEQVSAACGNNCAVCPRYTAHPYEKSEEELHHTAELWMRIGYRVMAVSRKTGADIGSLNAVKTVG